MKVMSIEKNKQKLPLNYYWLTYVSTHCQNEQTFTNKKKSFFVRLTVYELF